MRHSMILTGDVNLRNFGDPSQPFALVSDALGSADVVYGNLENCFYDSTVPIPFKGQWLHTATALAPALKEAGFHAVGCANNVTYGADAILSTLALLDEMESDHTGAGRDILSARAPVVIERDGVRLGFIQRTSVFWPIGHRNERRSGCPQGVHGVPGQRPNRRDVRGTARCRHLARRGAP